MTSESTNSTSEAPAAVHRPTANDYIFTDFIGEGSFSMVFKACSASDHSRVFAIKACLKAQIRRERKVDAIHREKKVMSLLSKNPYFISLVCTFQDDTRLYFVMPYAKYGELLKYIPSPSFDITCARFYAGEILMGLEYLHNRRIVHR